MKLAFISQAPTPYLTPILNELAERVDLHVIFMAGRKPSTTVESWATFHDPWGTVPRFEYSFHPSFAVGSIRRDFHARISAGVSFRLARLHADLVLVHGWGPLMMEPLLWRLIARKRAVMWTESTQTSGLLRDPVSEGFRRAMLRGVDTFVSNGSRATQYVEALGVSPGRVVTSCLPSIPGRERLEGRPATPIHAGSATVRFLFVGRFVPRKRPLDLIAAFRLATGAIPGATLTIVGNGPLRADVEAASADLGDRVRMIDRLEGAELSSAFSAADILVVPSEREVWGLVVNEGLLAGLYVIATDQVGSAFDLLRPGTGTIVPTADVSSLAAAMKAAMRDVDRSPAARLVRAKSVQDCTPRAFAAAILEAADRALHR
jgi:glycosyltransferase involved in cell wall biosynthesis